MLCVWFCYNFFMTLYFSSQLFQYFEYICNTGNLLIHSSGIICLSMLFIFMIFTFSVFSCDQAALIKKGSFGALFFFIRQIQGHHYSDIIMSSMASQIAGVSIVCSTVGFGTNQRKHQSSASLAFVWGIQQWPLNSPHKGPVTRKRFPFDDVIMRGRKVDDFDPN